jgi:flagellar hook-length control protein FliK
MTTPAPTDVAGPANSLSYDAQPAAPSAGSSPQASGSVLSQPFAFGIPAGQISPSPALGQTAQQAVQQSGEPTETSTGAQALSDISSEAANDIGGDATPALVVEGPASSPALSAAIADPTGATGPSSVAPATQNNSFGSRANLTPVSRKQEPADEVNASFGAATDSQPPSVDAVTSTAAQASVASSITETPGATSVASAPASTSTVQPARNNPVTRGPSSAPGSRRPMAIGGPSTALNAATVSHPLSVTGATTTSPQASVASSSTVALGAAGTSVIDAGPIHSDAATEGQPSGKANSESFAKPYADDNVALPGVAVTSDSDTGSTSQNPNTGSDKTFAAVWNPSPAAPSTGPSIPATAAPGSAAMSGSQITVPKVDEPLTSDASSHVPSADSAMRQLANEGPELSAGLQAWNGGENLQGDVTQAAHLMAKAGQSEMNIAMQAELLGAVQVRAHVTGDQVGAAITVERHEARAFLNNDLPALHQALNDRQLFLEKVSVDQGSPLTSGAAADGSGQQQSQNGSQQRSLYSGGVAREQASIALMNSTFSDAADTTDTRVAFDSDGRLSVRA